MRLTRSQYQPLHGALLSAFPSYHTLARLVRYRLDRNLESIAGAGGLDIIASNLMDWAEANGLTEQP